MRILIDGRFYGLENAGLGRYALHIIDNIKSVDKKNSYLVLLRDKYYKSLHFPSNWEKIRADYGHYGASEQLMLPRIIRGSKADLVHFLHFNVPVFGGVDYVVTIHDLLMHKQKGKDATTLAYPKYMLKRLGYYAVFGRAVGRAKKIIVPTEVVKKEVVGRYPATSEKIEVIYEGVDSRFEPGLSEGVLKKYKVENKYFVYAGNAYPHKNLKRLVEAMVFLNKGRKQKIELLVVSARNVFGERLEKVLLSLGASDYVKLLGYVPDEDLVSLYSGSIGFVYPSLSEGFGLPGLEAMASGTLTLASDISVFREVYGEAAIYFNPYDFSAIQKAMELVLDLSEERRKQLVKKGKRQAKKYDWEKAARKTVKVYENCAGL